MAGRNWHKRCEMSGVVIVGGVRGRMSPGPSSLGVGIRVGAVSTASGSSSKCSRSSKCSSSNGSSAKRLFVGNAFVFLGRWLIDESASRGHPVADRLAGQAHGPRAPARGSRRTNLADARSLSASADQCETDSVTAPSPPLGAATSAWRRAARRRRQVGAVRAAIPSSSTAAAIATGNHHRCQFSKPAPPSFDAEPAGNFWPGTCRPTATTPGWPAGC